jgi:Spy/CpxP family protein refolding chaperone
MKKTLIAMLGLGVIASTGFAVAHGGHGGRAGWHRGNPLDNITETLNLTPDQQAKVQPILDAAKPQMVAIHQEAMQKMHTVMNNTLSQIRPMLNADQQSKLDAIEKAHQDMLNAKKQLHDAMED